MDDIVGPPRPGPLLAALLASGTAYMCSTGYNYCAVAADGVEVCLSGPLMDDEHVRETERYLSDHPGPKDW